MNKHGMLCCGLMLSSAAQSAWLPEDPTYNRLLITTLIGSPFSWTTALPMGGSEQAGPLSESDRRVLLAARNAALQALAGGDLADVHLQAALLRLRSRYPLQRYDDLQLAQWIATYQ